MVFDQDCKRRRSGKLHSVYCSLRLDFVYTVKGKKHVVYSINSLWVWIFSRIIKRGFGQLKRKRIHLASSPLWDRGKNKYRILKHADINNLRL